MRRAARSIVAAVGLVTSACAASAPSADDASQAPPQVLPTGACELTVKHFHEPLGAEPEVATRLGRPRFGAPFRVVMDAEVNDVPGAVVSAEGEGWPTTFQVVHHKPDGGVGRYELNRVGPAGGWRETFRQVGTHVIRMSSDGPDCAATLVFEVSEDQ